MGKHSKITRLFWLLFGILCSGSNIFPSARAEESRVTVNSTVTPLFSDWDPNSSTLPSLLYGSCKAKVMLDDAAGTQGDYSKGFVIDMG